MFLHNVETQTLTNRPVYVFILVVETNGQVPHDLRPREDFLIDRSCKVGKGGEIVERECSECLVKLSRVCAFRLFGEFLASVFSVSVSIWIHTELH